MLRAIRRPPAARTPPRVFLFISFLRLRPRQCPPLRGLGDLKLNPWGSWREGTGTQQSGWIPAPGIGGGSRASGGAGAYLGSGTGTWVFSPGTVRPVNSQQAGACRCFLTLRSWETRVRPLQVEKPDSGLCRSRCKMLQAPEFL